MVNGDFLEQFEYLVRKYVRNTSAADELIEQAKTLGPSAAKGLMYELNKHAERLDSSDSKIIKDIAFYYIWF